MESRIDENRRAPFLASVGQLSRHLPLLGGALGVPLLSAGAVAFANLVTRELFSGGGDATALLATQIRVLTVVFVKLSALGEQMVTLSVGS